MIRSREENLKTKIAGMLPETNALKIKKLPVSGNNRLYRVDVGKQRLVAKHYFTHIGDKRSRLDAEFSFASFAVESGLDCVPRPVARDDPSGIALYSFVDGRKPDVSDVTRVAVTSALNFLADLNRYRNKMATRISTAAEACFSIDDHIGLIEKRLQRLAIIQDPCAKKFVEKELIPVWNKVKPEIFEKAASRGLKTDEVLTPAGRIVSPSDFGFHNALITKDGRFHFLDFEYGGWDDPAKTVGDFFSQIAIPVPLEYLEMFAGGVSGLTPDPEKTLARIGLLLCPYRIKWCCIVMNHFVPVDSDRRRFAGNDLAQTRQGQLAKARELLRSRDALSRRL
jgi:hypothetical protein